MTLSELIASEGMKEMVKSLDADINLFLEKEQVIHSDIDANAENLRLDGKQKKDILTFYQARMKEYLNELNVGVLTEGDYRSLEKQIKNNALGSDLPRSLLAQYYAFLHTMQKFNTFVLCPMIIDSPFQQEQDTNNKTAILDFILSRRLPKQQVIIATVSIDEFKENKKLDEVATHLLKDKLSLLRTDEFDAVNREIEGMHSETLASAG